MKRFLTGLGCGCSAFALAAAAYAQTPVAAPVATPGNDDGQGASEIEEIVVTAQRTESLASKTPVALSAISGEALRTAGVTNPTALGDQVPNLAIVRSDGLRITIRGVTSNDNSEKGDPSAAFLQDGVYIARPQVQEVSFYDLARVEVLRGPQGTLYGRNTTAGLVNLISARPSFGGVEGALNATLGNYDTRQADGMLNIPVNDVLALRFSGSYDRRDNYLIQNAADPNRMGAFKDNLSGRAQALVRLGDRGELLLKADYSRMQGEVQGTVVPGAFYTLAVPVGQPAYTDPVYVGGGASSETLRRLGYNLAVSPETDNSTWGLSGELNWDFGPVAVTYLGSHREFTRDELANAFIGMAFASTFDGEYQQDSHELRFATEGDGPFKLQGGGYWFQEESSISYFLRNLVPGVPYYGFPQDPTVSETWGVFAQGVYSLTPALRLTAGARYSHDDKSRVGFTSYQQGPVFNPATDLRLQNSAQTSSSKVTWRLGVDYDLNDDTLVFATVSTGYKAGGFNDGCTAGTTTGGIACNQPRADGQLYYEPETLTAYEAGVKTKLADNKVRLSAAAFYYDYQNLQLSTVGTFGGAPVQVTTNAAAAEVKGLEAEAIYYPNSRNRFDAAVTLLDAEYASYFPRGAGAAPDYKGRPLDRAPSAVVSAGYTYTHPLSDGGELSFGARTRWSDSYVITVFSTPRQFEQPSFFKTDVRVAYTAPDDRWYVEAFGKNLEDEVTVNAVNVISGQTGISPGDPLTYGVRTGFKF